MMNVKLIDMGIELADLNGEVFAENQADSQGVLSGYGGFATYQEYLESDHWKFIRQRAIKKAGNRCMICNEKGTLVVHHRTYERLGEELPEDVIVLCHEHHRRIAHDVKIPLK